MTTAQKYFFESILALFRNDIKDNVCTLVTFADDQRPPVLAALEALDDNPLPFEKCFQFNNSALFTDNRAEYHGSLSAFFWEMGMQSCRNFFNSLHGFKTRSLLLTSEVLTIRQKLNNTILNLPEEIDLYLSKLDLLKQEFHILKTYNVEIRVDKNFEYEVDDCKIEKKDTRGKGIHTTTCLICNYTCHTNCDLANDDEKEKCLAMGIGDACTECPQNCHWKHHSNVPVSKLYTQKVKTTDSEKIDKYQQAHQKKLSQERGLQEIDEEIKKLEISMQLKVAKITEYRSRLKEIALRPDPLSTVQYIELMIDRENRERKSGFDKRVEVLHQLKKRADIGTTCQHAMKAPTEVGREDNMKINDKIRQLVFGRPK